MGPAAGFGKGTRVAMDAGRAGRCRRLIRTCLRPGGRSVCEEATIGLDSALPLESALGQISDRSPVICRILFVVERSPHLHGAFSVAQALGEAHRATIDLIGFAPRAVGSFALAMAPGMVVPVRLGSEDCGFAEQHMRALAASASPDISLRRRLIVGQPRSAVSSIARQGDYDVMIAPVSPRLTVGRILGAGSPRAPIEVVLLGGRTR